TRPQSRRSHTGAHQEAKRHNPRPRDAGRRGDAGAHGPRRGRAVGPVVDAKPLPAPALDRRPLAAPRRRSSENRTRLAVAGLVTVSPGDSSPPAVDGESACVHDRGGPMRSRLTIRNAFLSVTLVAAAIFPCPAA